MAQRCAHRPPCLSCAVPLCVCCGPSLEPVHFGSQAVPLPCTLRPKKNSDTFTLTFTLHRCDWAFPCGVLACCFCLLTCCLSSHRAPLLPVVAVLVEKRAEGSAVAPRADRPGRLLLPVLLGRCRGGVSRTEAGPGEQHSWLRPPPVPRPRSRPRGSSLQLILAIPPAR